MDEEIIERNPDLLLNLQWEEKRITCKKQQTPSGRSQEVRGGEKKKSFRKISLGNVRGNLVGGQGVSVR